MPNLILAALFLSLLIWREWCHERERRGWADTAHKIAATAEKERTRILEVTSAERSRLLNRIQHPALVGGKEPVRSAPKTWTDEAEADLDANLPGYTRRPE
jgi:hypothetical protein